MFRTKLVEEITATMASRMHLNVTFAYIVCLVSFNGIIIFQYWTCSFEPAR